MQRAPRLIGLNLIEHHDCLVTEAGLRHMAETCPPLKSLSLETEAIHDELLERIASRSPSLTELDLACPGQLISDRGVLAVAGGCRSLTSLNVEGQRVTDASLLALAAGCPELQSLNIAYCEVDFMTAHNGGVVCTDVGVTTLAQGCPRLTHLDLTCSQVTDQGLHVLAECCGELAAVNLTSCRDVVGHGVGALLDHCEKLTELKLRSCDGLTDTGVAAFAAKGERVTHIEIGGSWSSPLSDVALDEISQGCPALISLSLQCIDGITDAGIRRLVDDRPSLEFLSIVSCELVTAASAAYAHSHGISSRSGLHEQTHSGGFSTCVDLMCARCAGLR